MIRRKVTTCVELRGRYEWKHLLRLDNSWDDPAVDSMSLESRAAGTLQVWWRALWHREGVTVT